MKSPRKLNVAIVGCGRIARKHLEAYTRLADRFVVRAVVDKCRDKAAALGQEFGVDMACAALDEAATDAALDCVDLCLPPGAHCRAATAAAGFGFHVLVEKPLAVSTAEADAMIEAGRSHGVVVMCGQSRRFGGPLRKAKAVIDAGTIGQPLLGYIAYGMKVALDVAWWADPSVSGPSNLLSNWGSHSLDEVCYLYGRPARVYAEGRDTGGPTAGIDLFSAVLGYGSGLVVNMIWSYVGELATGQLSTIPGILASKGVRGCVGSRGTLQYGEGAGPTGVLVDGQPVANDDRDENPFERMLSEFHASIVEQREPETSAARCRVVVELIEAILDSCQAHEVFHLNHDR